METLAITTLWLVISAISFVALDHAANWMDGLFK